MPFTLEQTRSRYSLSKKKSRLWQVPQKHDLWETKRNKWALPYICGNYLLNASGNEPKLAGVCKPVRRWKIVRGTYCHLDNTHDTD